MTSLMYRFTDTVSQIDQRDHNTLTKLYEPFEKPAVKVGQWRGAEDYTQVITDYEAGKSERFYGTVDPKMLGKKKEVFYFAQAIPSMDIPAQWKHMELLWSAMMEFFLHAHDLRLTPQMAGLPFLDYFAGLRQDSTLVGPLTVKTTAADIANIVSDGMDVEFHRYLEAEHPHYELVTVFCDLCNAITDTASKSGSFYLLTIDE